MNKKYYLMLLTCLHLLFILPITVQAETHLKAMDLEYGGYLTEDRSPYILDESIYIPDNYELKIDKGVTIISTSTNEYGERNILSIDGDLIVYGDPSEPVVFDGVGMYFNTSTSTLTGIIIKNTDAAITSIASFINIEKSRLIDNKIGIISKQKEDIFPVYKNNNKYGVGGLGDTLEGVPDIFIDPEQNKITIHNSSIYNNHEYDVLNESTNPIDATNVWWRSPSEPKKIMGSVVVKPWLLADPDAVVTTCCSNILFLPGLEASRLYDGQNQLWEPNRNADVEKMFLDNEGKSIKSSINTLDIINSAFGLKRIYKSFVAMMNGVVADGSINSWLPYPYDWRMDAIDVVKNPTKLSTTSVSMIEELEKLAKSSKTGKVTIIAHSNGGLVSKALMKALQEKDKEDLVDMVINIAVPELGTPQAILSMLHGDGQSILAGAALSANTARKFSQNMPASYSLLPSQKFFENGSIKVISDFFSNSFGKIASSYETMKSFLTGNTFSVASSSRKETPLLLRQNLLANAESSHVFSDIFKSIKTKTLSIFGWGMTTSEGVEYVKGKHCNNQEDSSKCLVEFNINETKSGDGTVITNSNSNNADETLFFNLKKLNQDNAPKVLGELYTSEINHGNILESKDLLDKIEDTITEQKPTKPSYEKYFSSVEPVDDEVTLTIRIYSPVDIHVYDKIGFHTGPITDNPHYDYEDNIPSVSYRPYGDNKKMVSMSYDDYRYEDYKIVLDGTGAGSYIIEAELSIADEVFATTTFSEMPVTDLMNASLVFATSTESFTKGSAIYMDVDGDGISDLTHHTDAFLEASSTEFIKEMHTYIESMRKVILSLKLAPRVEKIWLNRFDRIVKTFEKNKKNKIRKIDRIARRISNIKIKNPKMDEGQKAVILSVFDGFLKYVEEHEI